MPLPGEGDDRTAASREPMTASAPRAPIAAMPRGRAASAPVASEPQRSAQSQSAVRTPAAATAFNVPGAVDAIDRLGPASRGAPQLGAPTVARAGARPQTGLEAGPDAAPDRTQRGRAYSAERPHDRGTQALDRPRPEAGEWPAVVPAPALREHATALVGVLLLIPTAFSMDARIAAMLMALAAGYAILNALVISKTSAGQDAVEQHHYNLSGRVGDVIGNVAIVQSYGRLSAEVSDIRRLMGELLAQQYPVLTWWGLLAVLTRSAATITMVAVFALGAVLVSRGELTVGQIVSFVAFAGLLIAKLDQLSAFAVRTHQQAPTLKTLFDLLDEKSGIVEKPDAQPLPPVAGRVAYEGVSYRFPGSDQGVFGLDFEAQPGMTIALVGPTGAGKTTTLALLQRLSMPDEGRILIDGHDIADVTLASLRQSVAVVFQDAGLFNRSIAENIQVGRASATEEEIRQAARLAEAHDFIAAKPGGYGYVIGERGALLSGGERQRLAIARAILKDAPILVLDEATSALDVETEGRIRRAIDALRQGRTTFIIAHRLSTVTDANVILVMDQGRIVERGSFAELVRMNGRFARMVQEGGFTVPDVAQPDPLATVQRQA